MGAASKIEWTQATWNPVTGCSKVSPGCANCYAERMALRLMAMGNARYRNGFKVALHPGCMDIPLRWRQPRLVFVNSMGDLFHEEVPDAYIMEVFLTMVRAEQHVFQVLTKRASRLAEMAGQLPWPDNVWAGVTVENSEYMDRVGALCTVPASVKFLSLEPLLGPAEGLDLSGIDWVIAGGESGPGARPMAADWVRGVRDACRAARVPFFFKQWGGARRTVAGRVLDGRTWDGMPDGCAQRLPA